MDKLDDNKFAHLLQPIRDLAANWDINIANELEDYLVSLFHTSTTCFQYGLRSQLSGISINDCKWGVQDVLESVTFSFEGGPNLNFAEGTYCCILSAASACHF